MTTYRYRLTLNDREIGVVRDALKHYRLLCDTPEAACPPLAYYNPAGIVDEILDRLFDDMEMTSTNFPPRAET